MQSYKDCTDFWFSMWLEKEILDGPEEMFRFQVLVEDGNKVLKGHMDVGKIAPEPIGGTVSDNILRYASVYKSFNNRGSLPLLLQTLISLVRDQRHSPRFHGARLQILVVNKYGAIGIETMTVPAGEYDTVVIGWKSRRHNKSHLLLLMNFPSQ